MKKCSRKLILAALASMALSLQPAEVFSQGGRRGSGGAQATRSLDSAAEKAESEYLSTLADLAKQYEDAGDKQKASEMLRGILKVKPEADVVKNKLKQFEEAIFKDNVHSFDLDPSSGWVTTGVLVSKDKPIRIEIEGTYRFAVTDTLGPTGYAGTNLTSGMVEGIPCGAVMGVIGKGNETGSRRNDRDLPRPFLVGSKLEVTPKETGPLLLRLNTPEGAKCTGRLKVKVTGNIAVTSR